MNQSVAHKVDVSVIIPAFNRTSLLRASIGSVVVAAQRAAPLSVECVVVDDGSDPVLADQLADLQLQFVPPHSLRVLRQTNAGSAAARLAGLRDSCGEFIQFLDSDDLLHPEKLGSHARIMRETGTELSYCDQATARPYDPFQYPQDPPQTSQQQLPVTQTPAELFVDVQIGSHTPVFRRDALLAALANPIIPQNRIFEPAGDTWLFFNCATQRWRISKVDGPFAVVVNHDEGRHSTKWEKTGIPALGISLVFALRCPETPDTRAARAAVGAAAFRSYRRLPRHFHSEYERLTLALYETSPIEVPRSQLGGRNFARLASVLGPAWAARILRRLQCGEYRDCKTIEREELDGLFSRMIQHVLATCGREKFESKFGRSRIQVEPDNV